MDLLGGLARGSLMNRWKNQVAWWKCR